jgi:heat shock transcription factor
MEGFEQGRPELLTSLKRRDAPRNKKSLLAAAAAGGGGTPGKGDAAPCAVLTRAAAGSKGGGGGGGGASISRSQSLEIGAYGVEPGTHCEAGAYARSDLSST